MFRRLVILGAILMAPSAVRAQQSDAVAAHPTAVASRAAPLALVVSDTAGHRCRAVCGGLIGTFAGAALGAAAQTIAVYHKPASERDIGDGPSIALAAILGGAVGGIVGVIIGATR